MHDADSVIRWLIGFYQSELPKRFVRGTYAKIGTTVHIRDGQYHTTETVLGETHQDALDKPERVVP